MRFDAISNTISTIFITIMTNNIGYNSLDDTDLFYLFYFTLLIYFWFICSFKAVQQCYHFVYENSIKINYTFFFLLFFSLITTCFENVLKLSWKLYHNAWFLNWCAHLTQSRKKLLPKVQSNMSVTFPLASTTQIFFRKLLFFSSCHCLSFHYSNLLAM